MKFFLLIGIILLSQSFAYVDMSQTASRANDLNMKEWDYAFAMSIAGLFSGSIFSLFIWKTL